MYRDVSDNAPVTLYRTSLGSSLLFVGASAALLASGDPVISTISGDFFLLPVTK